MNRLEEKISIGVTAGIIAGIIKDIPDAFFHYGLKMTQITFWDYSGIIALGHYPVGLLEHICAIFFEIIFSIVVGLIFVYITTRWAVKKYLYFGAFYGAIIWFAIRGAVMGMGIQLLMDGDIKTAMINSMDSIIYGVILGFVIQYLEKKKNLIENH